MNSTLCATDDVSKISKKYQLQSFGKDTPNPELLGNF